jgi:hypothetical protein
VRRVPIALALALCSLSASAQQARDGRTPTRVGTATIAGVVVTDDREARPLRRARVSVTGSELAVGYTTITADDGTFRFDRLPAGRYSVTAMKEGFVPMAVRPHTEQFISAELREGQSANLTLRLLKGAVITGTVIAPDGTPAANVPVTPLMKRFNGTTGERRTIAVPFANTTTDDRGIYRIFGLPPGSYLVTSTPRLTGPLSMMNLRMMTDTEVKRALSEVKEQAFASRPGFPSAPPPGARSSDPGVPILPVPVYFPGTATEAQAVPIKLAAGEVRSGIDFDLQYVRPATVEGFATTFPDTRTVIAMTSADSATANQQTLTAIASADGRFTFRNVAPGHYAITATAIPGSPRGEAMPLELGGWGRTELVVSGDDIGGITVTLRPPVKVSGEVRFSGDAGPLASLAMALGVQRVSLPLIGAMPGVTGPPSVAIEQGRFAVSLPPVRYRFRTTPQGIRTPIGRWWLTSITSRGKELLDSELEFTEDVNDVVITFSEHASELSGTARHATGTPAREGHVVVFGANPQTWFWNSRRLAAVPLTEGRWSVKNLPAGDYFVTMTDGLERNEWFDPEMLAVLAKTAQRVTLGEFETKRVDLVK